MLKNFARLALAGLLLATNVAFAGQQSSLHLRLFSVLSSAGDLQTARSEFTYDRTIDIADGTGADQANQVWTDTRTLASNANETLDLNASLTNALGASVTFTKVKLILIRNKACTTTLSVGATAANQFVAPFGDATDLVKVAPGGIFLLTAPDATGLAVAAGSTDNLKIANSTGASCDYDIVLIGVN